MHAKYQKELFEFGNRCPPCQNRYCLDCFQFKCTLCQKDSKCKASECECKLLPKLIGKKLTEAQYLLVSQRTAPSSIDITLKYNFSLHHGEACLGLNIALHKDFDQKAEHNTAGESKVPENDMELIVDIKEGTHLRKKYVSKQTVKINVPAFKAQKIAAYCGGESTSNRHKQCLNDLNRLLKKKNIVLEFTDNLENALAQNEKPLLVISLIHSRAISDVTATFSSIEGQYLKRVIVVLLHFKESDQTEAAQDIIGKFNVFHACDYFLGKDTSSDKVADSVFTAIEKFDMQND